MKKLIEICIIIAIGFIYFIGITHLGLPQKQYTVILKYSTWLLQMVCAIAAVMVVFVTLNNEDNHRPSYLSISYFLLIILMVVELKFFGSGEHWINNPIYLKLRWFINFLEIAWGFICTYYISSKKRMYQWVVIQGLFIIVMSIYLVYAYTPIDWLFDEYGYQKTHFIIQACFMVVLCVDLALCRKMLSRMRVFSRRFWLVLFGSQFILHLVQLATVKQQDTLGVYIVTQFLNMISYVGIICFVEKLVLEFTWRNTDQGIFDKKQRLSREIFENKLLVRCAHIIQKEVSQIYRSAELFKEKVKHQNKEFAFKYIDKIINNCNRLTKLSKNILDLNSIEQGKMQQQLVLTDLGELVENLIVSLEPYVEKKGIRLESIVGEKPVLCYIDSEAIERVLLNLISNAIKYNKEGGEIKVFVSQKKQMIHLCVQDSGVGIPANKLTSIFERFERGDATLTRNQEGSGLGLAIVKSIVDMHQGHIRIMSKENKGTQICISFPAYAKEGNMEYQQLKMNERELKNKIQVEFSDLEM